MKNPLLIIFNTMRGFAADEYLSNFGETIVKIETAKNFIRFLK